jgi:hypothetical protein
MFAVAENRSNKHDIEKAFSLFVTSVYPFKGLDLMDGIQVK